jgi:membrane-bound serine protease (ClpP class)
MSPGLIRLYIILLVCGALLLGAEVFVPGGMLGVLGVIALLAALFLGFGFGWAGGLISAVGIVFFTALAVLLWVRLFPKTPVGRKLALARDGRDFKLDDAAEKAVIGREGTALSPLRPGGIGLVDGRRRDVITRGVWMDAGRRFRVAAVEGARLIVEPIEESPSEGTAS